MGILQNESTTIASKISRTDKKKLHAIADNLGLTFYALVQAILLTVVRYFDKGSDLSTEHRNMVEAFALVLKSTIGSYCPISARNKEMDNIKSAILFVERKAGQRPQLLKVSKSEFGNVVESYNYDEMLKAFMGATDPTALRCLEDEAKELGNFSLYKTLHELIMKRETPTTENITHEIEELFNDVRISTGQAINEDIYYQRRHRTNVDEYTTISKNETYRADI